MDLNKAVFELLIVLHLRPLLSPDSMIWPTHNPSPLILERFERILQQEDVVAASSAETRRTVVATGWDFTVLTEQLRHMSVQLSHTPRRACTGDSRCVPRRRALSQRSVSPSATVGIRRSAMPSSSAAPCSSPCSNTPSPWKPLRWHL